MQLYRLNLVCKIGLILKRIYSVAYLAEDLKQAIDRARKVAACCGYHTATAELYVKKDGLLRNVWQMPVSKILLQQGVYC